MLPDDPPFLNSLGMDTKVRLVKDAEFARDLSQAISMFDLPDPDETIVLIDAATGGFAAHALAQEPEPEVTSFSANRVVISVKAKTPGWLFYADAFHPSWKAHVNGAEAQVYQANIGFKAVAVAAGVARWSSSLRTQDGIGCEPAFAASAWPLALGCWRPCWRPPVAWPWSCGRRGEDRKPTTIRRPMGRGR